MIGPPHMPILFFSISILDNIGSSILNETGSTTATIQRCHKNSQPRAIFTADMTLHPTSQVSIAKLLVLAMKTVIRPNPFRLIIGTQAFYNILGKNRHVGFSV